MNWKCSFKFDVFSTLFKFTYNFRKVEWYNWFEIKHKWHFDVDPCLIFLWFILLKTSNQLKYFKRNFTIPVVDALLNQCIDVVMFLTKVKSYSLYMHVNMYIVCVYVCTCIIHMYTLIHLHKYTYMYTHIHNINTHICIEYNQTSMLFGNLNKYGEWIIRHKKCKLMETQMLTTQSPK